MSPSKQANAQLNGINPTSCVASRVASATVRAWSRRPSQQSAAARTTRTSPGGGWLRGLRRERTRARRDPAQRRRRRWPSPIRRKPTPAERPAAAASRRANSPHDEGRQPMRRTARRRERLRPDRSARRRWLRDLLRRRQEHGRPSRAPYRANPADGGRTHGCCTPVTPAARPDEPVAQMPDRCWRWRIDPVRPRRPRAATAPRPWPPRVAAIGPGRRRRRRRGREEQYGTWRSSGADAINRRISLVNSSCGACYGHVNYQQTNAPKRPSFGRSELKKPESSCVTGPLAITEADDRGSNR